MGQPRLKWRQPGAHRQHAHFWRVSGRCKLHAAWFAVPPIAAAQLCVLCVSCVPTSESLPTLTSPHSPHALTHSPTSPHSPHQTTLYLSASQHLTEAPRPCGQPTPTAHVSCPPPYIEMNIALCLPGSNTAVAPCPASCLFTHTSSAALIAVCPAGAMSAPALSRAFCLTHPPVLAIVPFPVYRFLVLLPVVSCAYRILSLMPTASNAGPATVFAYACQSYPLSISPDTLLNSTDRDIAPLVSVLCVVPERPAKPHFFCRL